MRKYTRNCNNDRKNVCGPRSSYLPTNIVLFLLTDANIMMVQSHLLLWCSDNLSYNTNCFFLVLLFYTEYQHF